MARRFTAISLPLLVAKALADLTPTAPGPGQSYSAGSNCTIQWDVDQSGTWTNVTIGTPATVFIIVDLMERCNLDRLEVRV